MRYRSLVVYLCLLALGAGNARAFAPAKPSSSDLPSRQRRPLSEYLSSGMENSDPRSGASGLSASDGWNPPSRGSEFISGYYQGAVLMPVRLWGAVRQSGLHQVPTGTDLMQLITLAGGPNSDAEMDNVTIKRSTIEGEQVIKVSLDQLISSKEQPIELQANDTVIIPASKPFIDQNTLTLIGVITSVVGIVASSVLIANQVK